MRRPGWAFLIGLSAWVFYAVGCATTKAPQIQEDLPDVPHTLSAIRVVDSDVFLDLTLSDSSKPLTYSAFKAVDPLSLVVEMADTLDRTVASPGGLGKNVISKITCKDVPGGPMPATLVRIVLKRDVSFHVAPVDEGLRVHFEAPSLSAEAVGDWIELVVESRDEISQNGTMEAEEVRASDVPPVVPSVVEPPVVVPLVVVPPVVEPPQPKPVAPASPPPARKILAFEEQAVDEGLKVCIHIDGSLERYYCFHMTNPPRVVVDLKGVRTNEAGNILKMDGPLVEKIRVGLHEGKVRVVFDLIPEGGIPYEVSSESNRLHVTFTPGNGFPP